VQSSDRVQHACVPPSRCLAAAMASATPALSPEPHAAHSSGLCAPGTALRAHQLRDARPLHDTAPSVELAVLLMAPHQPPKQRGHRGGDDTTVDAARPIAEVAMARSNQTASWAHGGQAHQAAAAVQQETHPMYCGTLPLSTEPMAVWTNPGSRARRLHLALPAPELRGTHGDTSTTGPTILAARATHAH